MRTTWEGVGRAAHIAWTLLLLASIAGTDARIHSKRSSRSLLTPGCRMYMPGECALQHSSGPAHTPFCHRGDGVPRECAFNTTVLSDCPLYTNGTFAEVEAGKSGNRACDSSFMRSRSRVPPTCGASCCSGELPGDFMQHGRQPPVFHPNTSSCQYHEYNFRQVMECLAGTHLVIAGDSIMRQLFNAAVSLLRGQEIAIDYNRHSHARYRVCDSADSLQFGSFIPSRWEIPLEEIGQLFGAAAAHNEDFQCQQDSQLEVDYLWAPKYTDLSSNLREYHERVGYAAGARVSYLVFAGFWEDQQAVPEEYLTALDTIRSTAKSVILLSVPRVRLFGWKKDNALMRNDKTRFWARHRAPDRGGNVMWLDFDQLAHVLHSPPSLGSLNWHYQCFLDHNHLEEAKEELGGLGGAWQWPGLPDHIYPSLWTDDEVTCHDGMDKALWQIILNMLCNHRMDTS